MDIKQYNRYSNRVNMGMTEMRKTLPSVAFKKQVATPDSVGLSDAGSAYLQLEQKCAG